MGSVHAALAVNLDPNLLGAALPLFEAEEVDAIEWAFDSLYRLPDLPGWFADLLGAYGETDRLLGHGVFFSLFSGRWLPQQQAWLAALRQLTARFRFAHITEHFGFMTGANFHQGAPLSVPLNATTLALGIDRLQRIQDACQCPVGIENLAFAWSTAAVEQHGEFLRRLIEPVNGFIILDLHNVYCQAMNFGRPAAQLLSLYPLDRVREMHLSGGSWHDSAADPSRPVRRDTHDEGVPDAVFDLLQYALPRCPNLRFVVLEQLGTALATPDQQEQYRHDFRRMKAILDQYNEQTDPQRPINAFKPTLPVPVAPEPLTDEVLYAQQRALATLLETVPNYQLAQAQLATSTLAASDWQPEHWQPAMLETAIAIAQKWRNGFV